MIIDIINYHKHQKMAKVTDCIWLGCESDSDNEEFLTQNKIDVVLNVANKYPRGYSQKYPAYYGIMLIDYDYPDDDEYYTLIDDVNKATNFINEMVRAKKNILVHCHMGINRSPLVIGKYLMDYENYNGQDVYNLLKKVNESRGQKQTLTNSLFKSFFI